MKLIIAGSRSLKVAPDQIRETLLALDIPIDSIECIVSGGAKGIDKCAEVFAFKESIPTKIFLPDYESYGKGAPLRRNKQMAEYGDYLVLFHDGRSTGSLNMLSHMTKLDKGTTVVTCGNVAVIG
jgi:hypothetical protein